jgi:hypothetical protein
MERDRGEPASRIRADPTFTDRGANMVEPIARGLTARAGLVAAVLAVAAALTQPIQMPRIVPLPSDPPVIRGNMPSDSPIIRDQLAGTSAVSWPLGPS